MRHRGRVIGCHDNRSRGRAMEAFVETQGADAVSQRQRDIAALPTVQWKGRTLYTIRCEGDFGRGPHMVHVPESLLWSLLSVRHFRCAYHR